MTPELKTIADALAKLDKASTSEDAKRTLAMTQALQNISAALAGLVAAAEASNERSESDPAAAIVKAIADAIKGLRLPAPEVTVAAPTVNVEPATVNVPANPVDLTVQAGENHNHITMPEPKLTVIQAEWFDKEILFETRGDTIVRAVVKKLVP